MALTNNLLYNNGSDIFTCNNAGGAAIGSVIAYNSDTVARDFTLHAVPSGYGASTGNTLLKVSIPAGDSYVFDTKMLLANTEKLHASTDNGTATKVYATVSYLDL
jgi:hypothetical protein